jgi:altronate dehydratase
MSAPSASSEDFAFEAIGRLPLPGDNAAIAVRDLPPGTRYRRDGSIRVLMHGVPEGHRFAAATVAAGDYLTSWQLPFGRALRDIRPGEYLCNASVLDALRLREVPFPLPAIANFQNAVAPVEFDESDYRPGRQVALHARPGSFMGFRRPGGRGAGTRNVIAIIGTTSSTASFARLLEARLKADAAGHANIDGIVAVAHTEGSGSEEPHNLEFVLCTLAGFIVHPNIAAVLAVDRGGEFLDNERLRGYLRDHAYPLDHVPHRFYTLSHDLETSLAECAGIVRGWYAAANAAEREPLPLAGLKIALQCGGSDAFSGISGNPLAAWVAGEVIRHGGAAGLAETDELIGAEPYMLANTRDLETARRFLRRIAEFRERIAWHGHSAEGNPTGGNQFRGLYNISLKSIGAARKKDPDVRLDFVIGYAEPMTEAGFYFMDSPGNDLESIAGQVASGCNLIFFITGNGSITNFPFVPTVKFITTTRRWNLLSRDMDINAGRYLDGEPLEALGRETFDYAVRVASGARSVGERAGHAQVSIWRNWCQTDASQLQRLRELRPPDGRPIPIAPVGGPPSAAPLCVPAHAPARMPARMLRRIGLIAPTSLCAGQIALQIAGELNARFAAGVHGISRFVALPHTEGCGASSGDNEAHYLRTLIGHLLHPAVGAALLLEHGCEHTHNDLLRHTLRQFGIEPGRFGYASIQLDGGIEQVTRKVVRWFAERVAARDVLAVDDAAALPLSLGLTALGPVPAVSARTLGQLAAQVVGGGGTVVVPHNATLLTAAAFRSELGVSERPAPSLDYGQVASAAGLHVMATPGAQYLEALTGLGGTGVQVILAHVAGPALQGHPMIPTLQIAAAGEEACEADLDLVMDARHGDAERMCLQLQDLLRHAVSGDYLPRAWARGFTDFQLTRGLLGVSL